MSALAVDIAGRRSSPADRIFADADDSTPAAIRDRAIFETLYSSGLRVGELVGLDWRDIDEELGMVMVRAGKGNKDRLVPLGEPALDALKGVATCDAGRVGA